MGKPRVIVAARSAEAAREHMVIRHRARWSKLAVGSIVVITLPSQASGIDESVPVFVVPGTPDSLVERLDIADRAFLTADDVQQLLDREGLALPIHR